MSDPPSAGPDGAVGPALPSASTTLAVPFHALYPRPNSTHLLLLSAASALLVDTAATSEPGSPLENGADPAPRRTCRVLSRIDCPLFPTDVTPHASSSSQSLPPLCAPRIAAWSGASTTTTTPRHDASPAHSAAASSASQMLAVAGDDKMLRVYRVGPDGRDGLGAGEEVVCVALPKRMATLQWESSGKCVVAADRHGDVRAIELQFNPDGTLRPWLVPPTRRLADGAVPPPSAPPDAKRPKLDHGPEVEAKVNEAETAPSGSAGSAVPGRPARQQGDDGDDDDDDDEGPIELRPKLGHVSMLTDCVLTDDDDGADGGGTDRLIVTADKDEHIRVSRWGPRRAGHVILRYLLGSAGAVGFVASPPASWRRDALARGGGDEAGGAAPTPVPAPPLLLSGEGGQGVRAWTWRGEAQDACVVTYFEEALRGSVRVDARIERLRDRKGWLPDGTNPSLDPNRHRKGKGKRGSKGKAGDDEAKDGSPMSRGAEVGMALRDDEEEAMAHPLILTKALFVETPRSRQRHVVLLLDGATSVFHVPYERLVDGLGSLGAGSVERRDLSDELGRVEIGSPVLDAAVVGEELVVCCDTRPGVARGGRGQRPGANSVDGTADAARDVHGADSVRSFRIPERLDADATWVETTSTRAPTLSPAPPSVAAADELLRVQLYNTLVHVPNKLTNEVRRRRRDMMAALRASESGRGGGTARRGDGAAGAAAAGEAAAASAAPVGGSSSAVGGAEAASRGAPDRPGGGAGESERGAEQGGAEGVAPAAAAAAAAGLTKRQLGRERNRRLIEATFAAPNASPRAVLEDAGAEEPAQQQQHKG